MLAAVKAPLEIKRKKYDENVEQSEQKRDEMMRECNTNTWNMKLTSSADDLNFISLFTCAKKKVKYKYEPFVCEERRRVDENEKKKNLF